MWIGFATTSLPVGPQAKPASAPGERFRSDLSFVAVPLRFVAIFGERHVLFALVSLLFVIASDRAYRLRLRAPWAVTFNLALSVIGLVSGTL